MHDDATMMMLSQKHKQEEEQQALLLMNEEEMINHRHNVEEDSGDDEKEKTFVNDLKYYYSNDDLEWGASGAARGGEASRGGRRRIFRNNNNDHDNICSNNYDHGIIIRTDTSSSSSSSSSFEDYSSEDSLTVSCVGLPSSWKHTRMNRENIMMEAPSSPSKMKTTIDIDNIDNINVDKYMSEREMTPLQERMNALSVLPSPIYCLYFILSGNWINTTLLDDARTQQGLLITPIENNNPYCINVHHNNHNDTSWLSWILSILLPNNFYALPPIPVMVVALGVILHAPFSFIYHWKYAHTLPPGILRTTHWSRRMDQSMIHIISLCFTYATSGSVDYCIMNAFYNFDCIYNQFKTKVYPRRNKIRISISIIAYILPVLVPPKHADILLFLQLIILFIISGWLFVFYPIGGWSHTIFHLIATFVPPLLMQAACKLPISQSAMKDAIQCIVLAEQ